MRKIVHVHRKKDIISKNILERKTLLERKNGSFLGGSSLKEKLRKLALYAQVLIIVRKGKK